MISSLNGRATIVDIAREAEVSTATVDRVLNGRQGVRALTIDKVLRAARRLDYIASEPTPHALPIRAAEHPSAGPRVYDFVLPAGGNTFIRELAERIEGLHEELAPLPITGRVHFIEGFDPEVLARSLVKIGRDSKGVAFVALEHPFVREAVRHLVERGVTVVTLVSDLSSSKRAGYVGIDNRAAGRTAGLLLGRFIGPRAGKIAMIAGSLAYRGHEEREMGFLHIISEAYPDLEIVGLREGHDDAERNYAQTRGLLDQHPDLMGIYNIGAGSAGVGAALRESGRAGEICFIGHEITSDTRSLVVDGVMDAVVAQNPRREAVDACRMLLNVEAGRDPSTGIAPTRIDIYVRENLP
ncbi:LacI family DNA-binding transcriptional regulator [Pararobbsia silviterrae]|uniref:LacI family DNA-binding transcriptional regulator n=1 Tax=Pararobbsia silviterrae TaxID=1792498 RepID=A0A494XG61_9BURK|nr:LacI family DNA-binding transcriptional regulator [Pararobbsia silviterrae]RKP47064.1 LacI family DNA-binding transcriptional regulator [Pararobbsia silviterrae]